MVAVALREMLGTVLGVVARVASGGRYRVLALGNIRSVVVIHEVPGSRAVSRPQLTRRVRNRVDAAGPDAEQDHGHDQEGQPQPLDGEARAPAAVLLVAAALTG